MLVKILIIIFFIYNLFADINFYSTNEDLTNLTNYGLYPSNEFRNKKILDGKWYIRAGKDGEWNSISVPSSYTTPYPEQKIYFKTSFRIEDENLLKHYKLLFYGVNHNANVKINGNLVESHNTGFSTFEIDLSRNNLNFFGENELIVEVDNYLSSKNSLPLFMNNNGFKNYGGIFREIYLVHSGLYAVSSSVVDYNFRDNYEVCDVEIGAKVKDFQYIDVVENDSTEYKSQLISKLTIRNSSNELVFESEEYDFEIERYAEEQLKFQFSINNPGLWSPESPNLYQASISIRYKKNNGDIIESDQYDFNFGLREFEMRKGAIYLNGNRLKLQGVSRHDETKNTGNAITYQRMRYEVEKIKNMGANLIVNNFTPMHPYYLDLCDRYGLLVMQNIPLIGMPSSYVKNELLKDIAKYYISESVRRDINHPSVLAWGLGKDYNVFNLRSVDFISDLNDQVKKTDPKVLTFFDSKLSGNNEYYKITDLNVIQIPNSELDLFYNNVSNFGIDRVVLIGGIGRDITPGNENGFLDPQSEPSQARAIVNSIKVLKADDYVDGYIIDSFSDRRSEVPLLQKFNTEDLYGINNGLVDSYGKNRISFITAEAMYKGRKAPTLNQGEFVDRETNFFFIIGTFLTLVIFFMVKREHYLKNNIIRSFKNSSAFYIDVRDRRITQDWQSMLIGTFSAIGVFATISSMFYTYRFSTRFDYFLTLIFPNNAIKEIVIELIWRPYIFILVGFISYYLISFFTAVYIKLLGYLFRAKYTIWNAYILVLWSGVPYLFFLPFSAIFIRFISPVSIIMVLIFLIIFFIWQLIRIIQIMIVIYKTTFQKVFLFLVVTAIVILGGSLLYLKTNFISMDYLYYFFEVVLKQ